jgi:predicted PhzF superfamily epimerase YddE/YHI9
MRRLAEADRFAVIVTAPAETEGYDFVSRFFAPAQGVPEDPVTGSAHCTLAPYWAQRLGKRRLRARQVSARGGDLVCEWKGERVEIAGSAVLYLKGVIRV